MTIKFLKKWGFALTSEERAALQRDLDGGVKAYRNGADVTLSGRFFTCQTPRQAVKFAAALNTLRRPLHLIKQDLDADWARRVKERDGFTCALCGLKGDKINQNTGKKDVLTAHHWLKTKARAGMARWARPCGVTVHYAEHIHTLHENPCWADLILVCDSVARLEGEEAVAAALALSKAPVTEAAARAAWLAIPQASGVKGGQDE